MSENNKIVLVSNTSWSLYNFRLGLIRELNDTGFDVTVVAPRDSFTSKLIAEGISYREIEIKNYSINPLDDLRVLLQLTSVYKSIKPALIFHYTIKPNIYGSIAAYLRGIPSISVTTGLGHLFEFKNFLIRWITLFLYRVSAWMSQEMWFLNENDRDIFVYKRIVSVKKAKIIKGEGINTSHFSLRKKKNFNQPDRFLFAGRLIWDKGVQEYVDAAKVIKEIHPNCRFEMIGFVDQSNPKAVTYETLTQWHKLKFIKYLGETSDIRPYLHKATCLVFPSYYREGISRILMEAASMETPIITTDNVGCRDLVDDGINGFLVEPRNSEDLVEKINYFIELDAEDKLVMGKLGRKMMVKNFEEKLIINKYLATVKRLVGDRITRNEFSDIPSAKVRGRS